MSDALRSDFERLGFPVLTGREPANAQRGLIEVYPHVALLKLLSRRYRLECKVTKVRKYWPQDDPKLRLQRLLACWKDVLAALSSAFEGISLELPSPDSVRSLSWLKRYEDALDALVSAWVGTRFVQGRAEPCGDETAAIWIPA